MKFRQQTLASFAAGCLYLCGIGQGAADRVWYVHRTDNTNWVNGVRDVCRCYSVSPYGQIVGGTTQTWVEAQGTEAFAVSKRDQLTASDPKVCSSCSQIGRRASQGQQSGGYSRDRPVNGEIIMLPSDQYYDQVPGLPGGILGVPE
jgi:hypothetical protein